MKKHTTTIRLHITYLFIFSFVMGFAQKSSEINTHPNLILTQKGVEDIRVKLGSVPLFDETLAETKKEVDLEIQKGILVPIPKDMAGGYTHEQHKKNFLTLQKAGVLFQILEEEKYAIYIRDMFLAYAKMYPTLPLHPQERSYARGKIFWQCLNDANWLVYASQAYDCIYSWLSQKERKYLEKNLFRPFADFLSVGSPQFFNRIHNHSTWGNVAVGMIGLVMKDQELIDRALYGLPEDNIKAGQKDNDGGFIKKPGDKAGFFANLDQPFSPDGYYTEGPYYQRYAMYPFMIFAEALQNSKPELKIFEYKNGLLLKSVYTLLNLTDDNGAFFPLNDGQKGMSYKSRSLVSAVDIAYYFGDQDTSLLSIAKEQGKVQLDATGLAVAVGLKENKETPFIKKSIELRDGAKGDEGGLAILRHTSKENSTALVFKYTAQGLSHGHYDKLSFSLYENGEEVLQDYGLARFVNIEQKNGGGYLKENTTWAKQTIAHNTIVQNETSHFNGDFETGSEHHSNKYVFDVTNNNVQVVSAVEKNAYPGTTMQRTLVLIKEEELEYPYVLDIMEVVSDKKQKLDLPYYYSGQIIDANFEYQVEESLQPLGTKNGYQHLWKVGEATLSQNNAQFNWFSHAKFYSITSAVEIGDQVIFGRIGANDPAFNLRRDPVYMLRKENTNNAVFASIIEPHGRYNVVSESATDAYSNIDKVSVSYKDIAYIAITITYKSKKEKLFLLATKDASSTKEHELKINGSTYKWKGVSEFTKIKNK